MTNPIHFTTAEEAVKVIKSGDHVHLSSVASAPQCLINAMCKRGEAGELKDVHVHHLHTEGPAPYADPKFEGVFQLDSFFVGANVRKVTQSGYADYIPIFLSETQRLYRCGAVPLKRFKDDVKEVVVGQDCGLNIESFNDIRVGDIVEGYEQVEVKRK